MRVCSFYGVSNIFRRVWKRSASLLRVLGGDKGTGEQPTKDRKTGSNNGISTTTTPTHKVTPPQQPPTPTPPKPPTTPPTTITLTPTTTPPPTEKRRAGGHPGGRIDGISYAAHWKREISRLNLPLHSLSNAKCCVPKKWVQLQRCSS